LIHHNSEDLNLFLVKYVVVKPDLSEDSDTREGLACKLVVTYDNCGTSNKLREDLFECGARSFYGLQCIGKGHTAVQVLCAAT